MESEGIVLTSYPPQCPYICPNCGWKTTASEVFPKIEYQEIENEENKE